MSELTDAYASFAAFETQWWAAKEGTDYWNDQSYGHSSNIQETVESFPTCEYNFGLIKDALYELWRANQSRYGGGYGLYNYHLELDGFQLGYELGEGDWKSIMRAWWNAPLAGWGWTIQFIDFMRKSVWNEPMNIIEQESFM